MKLVMTLCVRDDADVIDAQLAFHLNAGVDLAIVTDNRSTDGTTDILESYARQRLVHLLREPSEGFRQAEWVTRMARLAAEDMEADWIIHSDADEFWWPRGDSLKSVLGEIPRRYGTVRGVWRHFVPRPGEGSFAERMTARLAPRAAITNPVSPFPTQSKAAHRADPGVVAIKGNHLVASRALQPLRGWYPLEVLHFPIRSRAQCEQKYRKLADSLAKGGRSSHPVHELASQLDAGGGSFYDAQLVDDAALARGIETGALVLDTRLRDALRELRNEAGDYLSPSGEQPRLTFARPGPADEIEYGAEAALLDEADVVRFQARLDRLEAEVNALRLTPIRKLRWKLSHLRHG